MQYRIDDAVLVATLCPPGVSMSGCHTLGVPSPACSSVTTTRSRTPSESTVIRCGHSVSFVVFLPCPTSSFPPSRLFSSVPFWRFLITGADQNQELKMWCTVSWTCLQTIRWPLLLHRSHPLLYKFPYFVFLKVYGVPLSQCGLFGHGKRLLYIYTTFPL